MPRHEHLIRETRLFVSWMVVVWLDGDEGSDG